MKKIILFDIDHVLFDTEKFIASNLKTYSLYEDVVVALNKLSKIAILGIFSRGDLKLQRSKLNNTKINSFFREENVHIFEDKIFNVMILSKYKDYEVFFIDDRLTILRDVKKSIPSIFTVWINRGFHARKMQELEGFNPDSKILSLNELESICSISNI